LAAKQARRSRRGTGRALWTVTLQRRRGEDGVSVVEVVLAFAILLLVLVPVSYVLMNAISQSGGAVQKTAALSIAEQYIECFNNNGPPVNANNLPNVGQPIQLLSNSPSACLAGPGYVTTEGGVGYKASATFNWTNNGSGNPDLCASGSPPQSMDLTVTISWSSSNSVTDTTVLNFPPPSVPAYGFLGVQINGDPAGSPPADTQGVTWGGQADLTHSRVSTVLITATETFSPFTVFTQYADGNGCAFMEVPPGAYNLTIGPDPPAPGSSAPPRPPTVTPFASPASLASSLGPYSVTVFLDKVTTPGPYSYDEGAYVQVQYPNSTVTENGVTCPNASANLECLTTGQSPTALSAPASNPEAIESLLSGGSWTTLLGSSGINRITSTACGNLCIGVGYSSTTGAAVYSDPANSTASWSPTGAMPALGGGVTVASLTGVQCPLPTVCLAIGTTSSGKGVILSAQIATSPDSVTWAVSQTFGAGSSVTQITCAGGECFVIGSNSGTGVVLVGNEVVGAQTWAPETLSGVTPTALTQITCSGGSCFAIGSTAGPVPLLVAGPDVANTQTWNSEPLQVTTGTLTQIACSGSTACVVVGTNGGGAGVIEAGPVSSAPAQSWQSETTVPGAPAAFTQVTCSGIAACVALGTNTSGNALLVEGPVQPTPGTWFNDTPVGGGAPKVLTQLTCSGTVACVVVGSAGSGVTQKAAIVTGPVNGGSQHAFVLNTLSGSTPVWFSGVACYPGSQVTCEAAGATSTGAVILGDTNTTSASSTWSSTPMSNNGMYAANLPIGIVNSALPAGGFYQECGGSQPACTNSIGPLFPFNSGYQVGAGTCIADLAVNTSVQVNSVPGTTSSALPVTLPLGLLSIEVVNGGVPVPNATVTATVDDTTSGNAACNTAPAYSLAPTGPDGLTQLSVIYESYSITVNGTSVGTIQMNPSTAVFTPISGSPVAYPLPTPVQVP